MHHWTSFSCLRQKPASPRLLLLDIHLLSTDAAQVLSVCRSLPPPHFSISTTASALVFSLIPVPNSPTPSSSCTPAGFCGLSSCGQLLGTQPQLYLFSPRTPQCHSSLLTSRDSCPPCWSVCLYTTGSMKCSGWVNGLFTRLCSMSCWIV